MGAALGETERELEVLPENVNAVSLFLIAQTQWRTAAGGGLLGLDYAALDVAARAHGITLDADTLTRVQRIEGEIVRELAAQ